MFPGTKLWHIGQKVAMLSERVSEPTYLPSESIVEKSGREATRARMDVVHDGPWPRIDIEIPKKQQHSSPMYVLGIPWTWQSHWYA